MEKRENKTKLYRFINLELNMPGNPFALCDNCKGVLFVPSYCKLVMIEENTNQPCSKCR